MMQSKLPYRVVVLTHEHMNLLDLSGPVQALATASRLVGGTGKARYEVIVTSVDGGLITTSSGLQVMTVQLSAVDALPIDTILAPGGCKGEEFDYRHG